MRLLLIRHGETVDNVAGIYAGTTDSPLTTHGVIQASRLGSHLAATDVQISYIFSSDLQRAFKTAEAIRLAQPVVPSIVTQLQILREQDFGFFEGKHFYERPKDGNRSGLDAHREANANTEGFQDVESKQSMITRVEVFLDEHLIPLLPFVSDAETVVVVAHGIILTYLWRGFLARFQARDVSVAAGVMAGGAGMGLEYLGGWSNTGYLDLEVNPKVLSCPSSTSFVSSLPNDQIQADGSASIPEVIAPTPKITASTTTFAPPKLHGCALVVKAVNNQEHLQGLRKTRGGIGSLKHDEKQKTMDSFFKRQKLE